MSIAAFHSAPIVTQIFEGAVGGKFDVSELGMTYFLRTFKGTESPFVAIPVFPNRAFRHSAIYVNKASGIEKPEDLNGKTIGELALYSHDAGIIPKGILMDEYGFKPETCRWIIGGLDWPMKPIDFVPDTHPSDVQVSRIPEGKELGAMLEAGEIDALISADNPKWHPGTLLQGGSAFSRLSGGRARVLQAHWNLSHHAHGRPAKKTFSPGIRGLRRRSIKASATQKRPP